MIKVKEGVHVDMDRAINFNMGFAVHADETKKALIRQGVEFTDEDDCDLVFHQTPSHIVQRKTDKPNILYTAYEAPHLPDSHRIPLSNVDLVIGCSSFVRDIYKRYFDKKRVVSCPLGVDTKTFKYTNREKPYREPFVFLWVGAGNIRKGWDLIQDAWRKGGFNRDHNVMLYIKTTGADKVEYSENVIVDSRKVPKDILFSIYEACHCFLFPSYAEGFGLPLAEAMSTGLPCIYTPYGGINEFTDPEIGYPLSYHLVEINYACRTVGAKASVNEMIDFMKFIYNNYSKAVLKGKKASDKISKNFTWDHTGKRLKKIFEDYLNGKLYR